MKRYRIEIFARSDLSFITFAECEEPDINIDFLVSAQSKTTAPGQITASVGDFAQIRIDGRVYYQGIINDLSFDGSKTEITLLQLRELLNTEQFADVNLLKEQTIETWFSAILTDTFNGSDPSQNLPGFVVRSQSSTNGTHAETNNGSYNLYDLAVSFFKVYGVVIDISFDVNLKRVLFVFRSVSSDVLKIDLTVSDVIEYEIQPSLSSDSPNKMTIREQENPENVLVYYWHPTEFSGTIDTDPSYNRVVPVINKCEVVNPDDEETFSDAAYSKAEETLYSTRYDDLISVTIRADSNLVNDWQIGQLYTLYADGRKYNTLLTGIHTATMASIELTFGYIRKRLTQILKMRKGN